MRALVVMVEVSAGLALAACSSSASTTGKTSAPTVTTTPGTSSSTASGTSSPSATAAVTAGGSASAAASGSGPTACAGSQLRAAVTPQSIPGLDRYVVRVVFTNTSSTTCTLTGYPGAAIVGTSGQQVQQAKRVIGGPVAGTVERVATLDVRSGASVFAYLEGVSTKKGGTAQAGCDGPRYPKILVTPPDTRTAVPFTIGWPQCHAFDVHPVREQ